MFVQKRERERDMDKKQNNLLIREIVTKENLGLFLHLPEQETVVCEVIRYRIIVT